MLVSVIPGADAPAVVGEMEMLNGQPRMASVTATTRVKVPPPPQSAHGQDSGLGGGLGLLQMPRRRIGTLQAWLAVGHEASAFMTNDKVSRVS